MSDLRGEIAGLTLGELLWLDKVQRPVWGGHIDRGNPNNHPCAEAERAGIVARVSSPRNGYVITKKGREQLWFMLSHKEPSHD